MSKIETSCFLNTARPFYTQIKMDLIQAAYKGDVVEVKRLINQGADVNAKSKYDRTALMDAAQEGHVEVMHTLLQQGADVNAKNNYGWTALYYAAGNTEVVRVLLTVGADVNAKTTDGWTALMIAAQNGHGEVCALIEAEGVWRRRKALLVARYSE